MAKKNSLIRSVAGQKATDFAVDKAVDEEGNPTPAFQKMVLRSIDIQRPLVLMNINRIRRKHPEAAPAEIADRLTSQYLRTVTGAGAAVGGTAVVPGIGTVAALGLSGAAVVGFLELTALYAQSIAELNGVSTDDPERTQALVMAVMLGEDGRKMLREFAGQAHGTGAGPLGKYSSGPGGGVAAIITGSAGISEVFFNQLKRTFFRKVLVRQGTSMLGRIIPFGVGAVIGGVGNRSMGKTVVKSAQKLFGPAPAVLPGELASDLRALPKGKEARSKAVRLMAERGDETALTAAAEDEDLAAEVETARQEHRRVRASQEDGGDGTAGDPGRDSDR